VNRSEVWLAELDKRRPVVIFRSVPWLTEIHAVPITSVIRDLPSEIEIAGLPRRSVANAQRLTLIDKTKLVRRVGQVDPVTMSELTNAVCAVLDC
jgi:mRNA-degrading endonuclease toxin of MazEF toxin-antitoxin module